jgi:hypothetical protein
MVIETPGNGVGRHFRDRFLPVLPHPSCLTPNQGPAFNPPYPLSAPVTQFGPSDNLANVYRVQSRFSLPVMPSGVGYPSVPCHSSNPATASFFPCQIYAMVDISYSGPRLVFG